MSVIKQIATYNGSAWTTDDIGANASNVSLSTNVAGQSNVQSALSKIVGTSALTASRAVVTGTGGVLTTSNVTSTQLGYLHGATSNIQTQINTLNTNLENINQSIDFDSWQYIGQDSTSAERDLNNYKTAGRYYFEFKAGGIANVPNNATSGWLQVFPGAPQRYNGGISDTGNFIFPYSVRQIWWRQGLDSSTGNQQSVDIFMRIYTNHDGNGDGIYTWGNWQRIIVSDSQTEVGLLLRKRYTNSSAINVPANSSITHTFGRGDSVEGWAPVTYGTIDIQTNGPTGAPTGLTFKGFGVSGYEYIIVNISNWTSSAKTIPVNNLVADIVMIRRDCFLSNF